MVSRVSFQGLYGRVSLQGLYGGSKYHVSIHVHALFHHAVTHKTRQTKFTVYRHRLFDFACGQAVIIQISNKKKSARNARFELAIAEATALEEAGPKCHIVAVYNLKSETF